MSKRLYVVTGPQGPEIKQRLVNATTRGTAVNHAAKGHFSASRASAEDAVRLMGSGVKVEEAGESSEEQEELPLDGSAPK